MFKSICLMVLMFAFMASGQITVGELMAAAEKANRPPNELLEIIKPLLLWGTITGVVPGVIILLIWSFCKKTGEVITKMDTTDYTEVPKERKEVIMREELQNAFRQYK